MDKLHTLWMPLTNQFKYTNLTTSTKTNGRFRNTVWDPFLIISQILALQCFYYLTLGIWLSVICFLVGTSRSLDHIFCYQEIHSRSFMGKLVLATFVLNALSSACAMWFLIQRTKLCLDFSSTIHFIHLLACWYYNNQFPLTFTWWSLNVVCLAVMCISGEFLCMRTELRAIPLSMAPKTDL